MNKKIFALGIKKIDHHQYEFMFYTDDENKSINIPENVRVDNKIIIKKGIYNGLNEIINKLENKELIKVEYDSKFLPEKKVFNLIEDNDKYFSTYIPAICQFKRHGGICTYDGKARLCHVCRVSEESEIVSCYN